MGAISCQDTLACSLSTRSIPSPAESLSDGPARLSADAQNGINKGIITVRMASTAKVSGVPTLT